MRQRRLAVLLLAVLGSMGAQYRTPNFVVYAPNQEIAQQVGQYAEHYRKEKAVEWLGQEMPTWPQPCPLQVQVNMQGPSGATTFNFGPGGVQSMRMEIQGPLDRLLASVLPHEITHTVFAHHFRRPVPRWADEGGSVLSEDGLEKDRHDKLTRQILNRGQQIPLRRLFSLREYPPQVMNLYAQGFSMSDYLVKRSDRRTFLAFVGLGMQRGNNNWDQAVQTFYGHRSVEELEEAWLKYLRDTRGGQPARFAREENRSNPNAVAAVQPTGRSLVRFTVPPAQPVDPAPLVRGAMPSEGQVGERFGNPPPPPPVPEPRNIPTYDPRVPGGNWVPVYPPRESGPQVVPVPPNAALGTPSGLPAVQLGVPQFAPDNPVLPPGASPVGFPR